jgi:hypothetical protein
MQNAYRVLSNAPDLLAEGRTIQNSRIPFSLKLSAPLPIVEALLPKATLPPVEALAPIVKPLLPIPKRRINALAAPKIVFCPPPWLSTKVT